MTDNLLLLDKVLPFLTSSSDYLEIKDLKRLRLVNKEFCNSVDNFLENQPKLRPFTSDDIRLSSEAYLWTERCVDDELFNGIEQFGGVAVKNYYSDNTLKQLTKVTEKLAVGRNPFLSRKLVAFAPFWDVACGNLIRDFGEHIHFLEMNWFNKDIEDWVIWEPELIWKSVIQALSHLPNIKSLHLTDLTGDNEEVAHIEDDEAMELLKLERHQLPELPDLESLRITFNYLPNMFTIKLISTYSSQLRRIQFSLNIYNWMAEFSMNLPNLTELLLEDVNDSDLLNSVLKLIKAPQLVRLQLYRNESENGQLTDISVESDVFLWLKLFQSLQSLDISCRLFSISERPSLPDETDQFNSLKYLKIHNSHGLNYNFLKCLKSLERLQITADPAPMVWTSSTTSVEIKQEIESSTLYLSNIWEVLPRLKSISLCTEIKGKFLYDNFDRGVYDKLKQNGYLNRVRDPTPLRGDIIYFLGIQDEDDGSDMKIITKVLYVFAIWMFVLYNLSTIKN